MDWNNKLDRPPIARQKKKQAPTNNKITQNQDGRTLLNTIKYYFLLIKNILTWSFLLNEASPSRTFFVNTLDSYSHTDICSVDDDHAADRMCFALWSSVKAIEASFVSYRVLSTIEGVYSHAIEYSETPSSVQYFLHFCHT